MSSRHIMDAQGFKQFNLHTKNELAK